MIGLNFGNALGTAYIRPCITVGIEEEFEKFVDFQIYPNPSNGSLSKKLVIFLKVACFFQKKRKGLIFLEIKLDVHRGE
jgi:hypothetical protein